MPRVSLLIFVSLFFFLKINTGLTQVPVQDSLALVALYNSTDGPNWNNNQNWLNTNVRFWYGITVSSGRVQTINLSTNGLNGSFPIEFCNLTGLEYMFFQNNMIIGSFPSCFDNLTNLNSINVENNQMEGDIPPGIVSFSQLADVWIAGNKFENMPSLLSLPEISNVSIENNRFTFEDIEYNMGILNFSYAPQDSILNDTVISINIHDTISFTSLAGGSGNQYSWIKDGQNVANSGSHIVGAATAVLTINKVALSDSGAYYCVITNSNVPLLTLTRKVIVLKVNDTRMDQVLGFQAGSAVYCGDAPFKLNTLNSSGLPVSFNISSGPASLTGDTLHPLKDGMVTVAAFNAGDDFYKPVIKDTSFQIFPHPQSGSFIIQTNSPVTENDSLVIAVQPVSALTYSWDLPGGGQFNQSQLQFAHSSTDQSGWYKVEVSENGCFIYLDSVLIEVREKPLLKYYELITPNGDGNNEVFYIENLNYYPDNELLVFNSWNQILYRKEGYQNDWNGGQLPSGTYYFTFKAKQDNVLIKGTMYIRR